MKLNRINLAVATTALATALLASQLSIVPAAGQEDDAEPVVPSPPEEIEPVDGDAVSVVPLEPDPASEEAITEAPEVNWPEAGAAEVDLGDEPAKAGDLPISVGVAPDSGSSTDGAAQESDAPSSVEVEVFDQEAASGAGIAGVVFALQRTDDVTDAGQVSLEVDYSGFGGAYGGDWRSRLGLVELPPCAATTPERPECRTATPIPSHNDATDSRVSAVVTAKADAGVFALAAAASGPTGDYKATALSPSGSWQVASHTGDFTWSYPLRLPSGPGGAAPSLALSYASSSVDGRTAATNNQPSSLGEGWSMTGGFIERRYKACAHDTASGSPATGDQCWGTENATMSFNGRSTELIRDDATGRWRPRADDGSRVEQLFGAGNGDDNGEHWKVTTTDGIQYFFGRNPASQSTWNVPVYGNDPGEPCHGATFAASSCSQAYRWNLDYVVDAHQNTVSYFYRKETNRYGQNMGATTATYDRGGTLDRVEYGTRVGEGGSPPVRVVFATANRCLPGADCSIRTPAVWPDTPWDQNCDTATCPGRFSPTFWSTQRLASITTQVRNGAGYQDVDRWTFDQIFPDPGDGTSAALWLRGITHTGLVGGSIADPPLTLTGIALQNRINTPGDGLPPMDKYRISAVNTEAGGAVQVNYAPSDCSPAALPAPDNNTRRCFPQRWTPQGAGQPLNDWFEKHVVAQVVEVDRVALSPTEVTTYDYLDGAAWRYNDDPLLKPEYRTWSEFRGYGRVRIRHGDPADTVNPQSAVEHRYFRGMHGDRLPNGGTRVARVTDSEGTVLDDLDELAGFEREQITYNGVGGALVSATITDPHRFGPTAVQGPRRAFVVAEGKVRNRVALAAGGYRRTEVTNSYDAHGIITQVDDRGDIGSAADDQCTSYTYARNTERWLLNLTSQVKTVGVACGATPSFPADAISDVRTHYDGGGFGAPPSAGDVTRTEHVASYTGATPQYVTVARATYDGYGRVLQSFDALDRRTTTAYTPATGLATSTTATNALGHTTTTTLAPAWGVPVTLVDANGRRTDLAYDALGRLTGVWRPGRSRDSEGPHLRYRYTLRSDGPSFVATERLTANANYVTSYVLYDGFLRERQTQQPGWGPEGRAEGRVITDKLYDSRGLPAKDNGPYYDTAAPSGNLLRVADNQIDTQTLTVHDGAERPVASVFRSLGVEKWRTTTGYGGDHVSVTPPAGGTATSTFSDARGRTTELRQYHGGRPTGTYDYTRYTYTKAGLLASVTDPATNTWTYTYDVRGRRTQATDPDRGTSTMTYDNAGQVLTTTDGRGQTIANVYDPLGRKREVHSGSATGPLAASWVYDSASTAPCAEQATCGLLLTATRHVGNAAYVTAVTGYDAAGQPTGSSLTIPASEGPLAGTYQTSTAWRVDGSPATIGLPQLGDLAAETLTFSYDSLGLPKRTTGSTTYADATTYNRFGQPTQVRLGSSGKHVWQTLYYDTATRRLNRSLIERLQAPTTVDDITYAYDPTGNITRIADATAGSSPDVQCFDYDHLRRLTDAWTSTTGCAGSPGTAVGGPAPYWTSLSYDQTGNRLTETQHGVGGAGARDVVRQYDHPDPGSPHPHALTSVTTTGSGAPVTEAYGYDAVGNTVTRPGTEDAQTLTWDAEGHLASVAEGDATTSYVYDAEGNRLISRDDAGATLYLGTGELRLETATGAKTGTRYYQHGPFGTVAVRTGSGVDWLFHDHQGSDHLAVDASTLLGTKRRQDPFGGPRGPQPSTWPGYHGFVGGVVDESTGLTHLGAREYDPTIGRFISVDPVIDPNDPQQMHGYSYANGNPVTFSDPDGLLPMASAPDGECNRGCPYKPGQGPASTYNPTPRRSARDFNHNRANCPDGRTPCAKSGASWWARFNARHAAAQREFARKLRQSPRFRPSHGDLIWEDFPVRGGSFRDSRHRNWGRADIVLISGNTIWVWEVKPESEYGFEDGPPQLDNYIRQLSGIDELQGRKVERGFDLTPPPLTTTLGGTGERLWVCSRTCNPDYQRPDRLKALDRFEGLVVYHSRYMRPAPPPMRPDGGHDPHVPRMPGGRGLGGGGARPYNRT